MSTGRPAGAEERRPAVSGSSSSGAAASGSAASGSAASGSAGSGLGTAGPAARRWRELLAAWAIEPEILAAAPESPWGFPAALWAARERDDAATPSRTVAAAHEALPPGGSVLDLGCGGGAGSAPLADVAATLVGVDAQTDMLPAYETAARAVATATGRRVSVRTVEGRWPEAAGSVGADRYDVVVAANVAYDVADLAPFVLAAQSAARRRVVLEVAVAHPQVGLAPLWRRFHGVERPSGPRVADLVAVLAELGIRPVVWRWDRPPLARGVDPAVYAAWVRRRLCLPLDREPEVAAALAERPAADVPVATVWWDVADAGAATEPHASRATT